MTRAPRGDQERTKFCSLNHIVEAIENFPAPPEIKDPSQKSRRWPDSKWRNLQEQQTEWGNLIKRPFIRLVNMLLKPQRVNHAGTLAALQQQSAANGDLIADMKTMQAKLNQKNPGVFSEGKLNSLTKFGSQSPVKNSTDKTKLGTDFSVDQLSQLNSTGQGIEDKLAAGGVSTVIDPSVSSTILDELSTVKNADFHNPSDCLVGNLSSSQDLQSQFTSASLGDSQAFSRQDLADNQVCN
ncbi:auxin response factor 5 isoform X2 [Prunus yedoensis var. nudiflora]|uniref:Auxin response factor 5 isoform X2 n=1 Tax=Prunus yedoensis var. nudiflora TaxID=2094558 RepID=A0A314UR10_PRUYE|nr:auxin response factor 5 isoform X2 [Prunus yedoensis var. nudiflora]